MMNSKTTYIIADAHLGAKDNALAGLSRWIQSLKAASSEVIFLGDLFHIWAGPTKYHSADVTEFLDLIAEFKAAGGTASLVVGNRDVFFKGGTGYPMKDLPFFEIALDFLKREIGGKTLLCAHGDLVNSTDSQYLRWRKVVRSPLFKFGFSLIPATKVKKMMLGIENKLKSTNQAFRIAFPEEEWEKYSQATRQQQPFDLLVVGHFHPAEPIISKGENSEAMVIPDWFASEKALKIDPDLNYEFIPTH